MIKWICFLLILFFQTFVCYAQTVTNAVSHQEQSNIIISYNLETTSPCKISLYVSTNGGSSWDGPLKMVKGDVGDKISSGEHSITWSVLEEYKELRGDNIKFQVRMESQKPTLLIIPNNSWCHQNGFETKTDNHGIEVVNSDYERALRENADLVFVITKINSLMGDRGFPIKTLQDAVTNIKQESAQSLVSQYEKLINVSKADIVIDFDWTVIKSGVNKSIQINLRAIEAYTGKLIASQNHIGNFYSVDKQVLLSDALLSIIDKINTKLQTYWDGLLSTVNIGKQVWTASNLNVSFYRNGDIIPEVQDPTKWSKLTTGAWCYYENKTENGITYGKLYNWYAVNDPRGLAPVGYHIPSDAEWTTLTTYLGSEPGKQLKSTSDWNKEGNGSNTSGFAGLPGGNRNYVGIFSSVGYYGFWWSSTEFSNKLVGFRYLGYVNSSVGRDDYGKAVGFSVRCLRD